MRTDLSSAPVAPPVRPVAAAAVAAAIFRRRREVEILLVQIPVNEGEPYANTWVLPGGEVALGETLPEAAVREVRTAAGIVIAVEALEWLWELPAVSAVGDHYRTHYFTGFAPEVIDLLAVVASIADCKWLTLERAYNASVSRTMTIPPATTEVLRRLSKKELS